MGHFNRLSCKNNVTFPRRQASNNISKVILFLLLHIHNTQTEREKESNDFRCIALLLFDDLSFIFDTKTIEILLRAEYVFVHVCVHGTALF